MCPDDTQAGVATVSYAINSNLSYGANGNANTDVGLQISQMTAPSKTVLLCEVANNTLSSGTYVPGWGHNYNLSSTGDTLSWNIPSSPGANGTGMCADPTGDNEANCNAGVPTTTATTMKYATGYFRGVVAGGQGVDVNSFASAVGRHNGGSCYVFADCHCKWLPGNNVSGGASINATWAPSCGGYNAGPGQYFAALTTCSDTTIGATWNYL